METYYSIIVFLIVVIILIAIFLYYDYSSRAGTLGRPCSDGCKDPYICDSSTNKCKLKPGSRCTNDSDCTSNSRCTGGVCLVQTTQMSIVSETSLLPVNNNPNDGTSDDVSSETSSECYNRNKRYPNKGRYYSTSEDSYDTISKSKSKSKSKNEREDEDEDWDENEREDEDEDERENEDEDERENEDEDERENEDWDEDERENEDEREDEDWDEYEREDEDWDEDWDEYEREDEDGSGGNKESRSQSNTYYSTESNENDTAVITPKSSFFSYDNYESFPRIATPEKSNSASKDGTTLKNVKDIVVHKDDIITLRSNGNILIKSSSDNVGRIVKSNVTIESICSFNGNLYCKSEEKLLVLDQKTYSSSKWLLVSSFFTGSVYSFCVTGNGKHIWVQTYNKGYLFDRNFNIQLQTETVGKVRKYGYTKEIYADIGEKYALLSINKSVKKYSGIKSVSFDYFGNVFIVKTSNDDIDKVIVVNNKAYYIS